MSIPEYTLRMEAYYLQQAQTKENIALQAFFNQMIQETTGSDKHPKPKYQKLSDLFDIESEKQDIRHIFEGTPPSNRTRQEQKKQLTAERWKQWEQFKERRLNNE